MNKRAFWATSGVFIAFIALFFLLNIAVPDRDFSEQENRSLQTRPEFSFESLFKGKYMTAYEKYCSDQFVLRDRWISLKARLELLQGKSENNGVYLCDNERLLEAFSAPALSELDSRVYAVNALTENVSVPVSLGLIPGAAEFYRDLIPDGVQNDSQLDVIDYVYHSTAAETLDVAGALAGHTDEHIFYRTDHHWTTLGAYYSYVAFCDHLGIPSLPLDSYADRRVVSECFYGTTYSTSGFSWVEPDVMEIFVEQPETVSIQRYEGPQPADIPLYDDSRLEVKDKYSYYLGGNTPRLVVDTGLEDKPTLLIIRDSYCDSLTPFLLGDFSEIHILDLRYYRDSVTSYVESNGIDRVLVLYSVSNFCTDSNIVLLTR